MVINCFKRFSNVLPKLKPNSFDFSVNSLSIKNQIVFISQVFNPRAALAFQCYVWCSWIAANKKADELFTSAMCNITEKSDIYVNLEKMNQATIDFSNGLLLAIAL